MIAAGGVEARTSFPDSPREGGSHAIILAYSARLICAHSFSVWRFAIIYELRVYRPVPGQMPKLLARFRDNLLPIWERHGIRPIGFWTTIVGKSSNELTYMLPWEALADRETRWTAFQNDLAWHKVREDSERDGPIVASISNQILMPTSFSVLK
jgi:hypothetical protein